MNPDLGLIIAVIVVVIAFVFITPVLAVIRKLQDLREAQHRLVELEELMHEKETHIHEITDEDVKKFGSRLEFMTQLPSLKHKLFVMQELIPKFFLLVLTLQFLTLFFLAYLFYRLA